MRMEAQRSVRWTSITRPSAPWYVLVLLTFLVTSTACAGSDAESVRTVTVTVTVPAAPQEAAGRQAAVGVATAPSGAGSTAKPAKYVYKVLSNYRATQLRYTASNGDMEAVNDNGTVTSGSDLPWTGEAALEPNGNPNSLSASTLSEKGNSHITCVIEDDKGNVVASDTGRGAYAGCYAIRPM